MSAGPQGYSLIADNKSDTFVNRSYLHNKTHNHLKILVGVHGTNGYEI